MYLKATSVNSLRGVVLYVEVDMVPRHRSRLKVLFKKALQHLLLKKPFLHISGLWHFLTCNCRWQNLIHSLTACALPPGTCASRGWHTDKKLWADIRNLSKHAVGSFCRKSAFCFVRSLFYFEISDRSRMSINSKRRALLVRHQIHVISLLACTCQKECALKVLKQLALSLWH